MSSGLEDAVAGVVNDWLSNPTENLSREGLLILHNYPTISTGNDVRKYIQMGWELRMKRTCEILSEHSYASAANWAGNLSALGGIAGAFADGYAGAGIGCLLGLLTPYAIADLNHYSIPAKTRWMCHAIEIHEPHEWERAIKHALQVHEDKLRQLPGKLFVQDKQK